LSHQISKIPIICICNDAYSQKIKSLKNHCLEMPFIKPSKQQVRGRMMKIAEAEGLQVCISHAFARLLYLLLLTLAFRLMKLPWRRSLSSAEATSVWW